MKRRSRSRVVVKRQAQEEGAGQSPEVSSWWGPAPTGGGVSVQGGGVFSDLFIYSTTLPQNWDL